MGGMYRVCAQSYISNETTTAIPREFHCPKNALDFAVKSCGAIEHTVKGEWVKITRRELKNIIEFLDK
jgi:hypothetical protein